MKHVDFSAQFPNFCSPTSASLLIEPKLYDKWEADIMVKGGGWGKALGFCILSLIRLT